MRYGVLNTRRRLNRGIWSLRCNRGNCPPAVSKPCWLRDLQRGRSRDFGVDLFGYLLSEIGLGEAARLLAGALDEAGIPSSLINVPLPDRQAEEGMAPHVSAHGSHFLALSVSSATELVAFAGRTCRGQRNVHYTYWELPTIPKAWREAFDGFDAYWAPTTFIRDMLVSSQDRPVHVVPQPIRLPDVPPVPTFAGPLRILTFFDYDSFVSRKNPQGAIEAFLRAFPAGTEDVELVVKARGTFQTGLRDDLYRLAGRDRRIRMIDRTVSRDEMAALMADCHVFLSLHRSEGFGLGAAEALAQGKAVVATNFGGARDFLTPSTGYPVSFRTVPLKAGDYPGAEGSHWAEPDVDHAAALLVSIHDDPAAAARRARAGYDLLRRNNSFAAVGARIGELLRALD